MRILLSLSLATFLFSSTAFAMVDESLREGGPLEEKYKGKTFHIEVDPLNPSRVDLQGLSSLDFKKVKIKMADVKEIAPEALGSSSEEPHPTVEERMENALKDIGGLISLIGPEAMEIDGKGFKKIFPLLPVWDRARVADVRLKDYWPSPNEWHEISKNKSLEKLEIFDRDSRHLFSLSLESSPPESRIIKIKMAPTGEKSEELLLISSPDEAALKEGIEERFPSISTALSVFHPKTLEIEGKDFKNILPLLSAPDEADMPNLCLKDYCPSNAEWENIFKNKSLKKLEIIESEAPKSTPFTQDTEGLFKNFSPDTWDMAEDEEKSFPPSVVINVPQAVTLHPLLAELDVLKGIQTFQIAARGISQSICLGKQKDLKEFSLKDAQPVRTVTDFFSLGGGGMHAKILHLLGNYPNLQRLSFGSPQEEGESVAILITCEKEGKDKKYTVSFENFEKLKAEDDKRSLWGLLKCCRKLSFDFISDPTATPPTGTAIEYAKAKITLKFRDEAELITTLRSEDTEDNKISSLQSSFIFLFPLSSQTPVISELKPSESIPSGALSSESQGSTAEQSSLLEEPGLATSGETNSKEQKGEAQKGHTVDSNKKKGKPKKKKNKEKW